MESSTADQRSPTTNIEDDRANKPREETIKALLQEEAEINSYAREVLRFNGALNGAAWAANAVAAGWMRLLYVKGHGAMVCLVFIIIDALIVLVTFFGAYYFGDVSKRSTVVGNKIVELLHLTSRRFNMPRRVRRIVFAHTVFAVVLLTMWAILFSTTGYAPTPIMK